MPTGPLRIALWGNFGTGNLGNECTLQAIVHNARRHSPDAELTCICSEPADTLRRHNVRALPINPLRSAGSGQQARPGRPRALSRALRAGGELRSWLAALAAMRDADMLVMAGTGMLADSGEGPLGLPYEIFKWSLAARIRRRRLLFVSVGAESIQHPLSRLFVRASLGLAHFRCYRDHQSRDLLERIGFAAGGDAVYPDLAFSLPEHLTAQPSRRRERRPRVAVGLYDYRGRGEGGGPELTAYRDYLDKLCAFVLWLLEHDYEVRIVIGDLSYDAPVRGDLGSLLEARGAAARGALLVDEPAASVEQLLQQLADADLVVATRFHSVLLGLLLGKPVVSVSYNEKNDALMAQAGLARYCQPIERLDLGRLIEQFLDLERNAARLCPDVLRVAARNREQLEELYALVFERA